MTPDHLMETTMKYTVIEAATKRQVLLGATLTEASRFCLLHRGHYFVPTH